MYHTKSQKQRQKRYCTSDTNDTITLGTRHPKMRWVQPMEKGQRAPHLARCRRAEIGREARHCLLRQWRAGQKTAPLAVQIQLAVCAQSVISAVHVSPSPSPTRQLSLSAVILVTPQDGGFRTHVCVQMLHVHDAYPQLRARACVATSVSARPRQCTLPSPYVLE